MTDYDEDCRSEDGRKGQPSRFTTYSVQLQKTLRRQAWRARWAWRRLIRQTWQQGCPVHDVGAGDEIWLTEQLLGPARAVCDDWHRGGPLRARIVAGQGLRAVAMFDRPGRHSWRKPLAAESVEVTGVGAGGGTSSDGNRGGLGAVRSSAFPAADLGPVTSVEVGSGGAGGRRVVAGAGGGGGNSAARGGRGPDGAVMIITRLRVT